MIDWNKPIQEKSGKSAKVMQEYYCKQNRMMAVLVDYGERNQAISGVDFTTGKFNFYSALSEGVRLELFDIINVPESEEATHVQSD